MSETKFFICNHCGNIVGMIHSSGVPLICCGEKMTELVGNTTDAAVEKHVPVAKVEDGIVTVTVGSTAHPMTEEHHIAWIYLQTNVGGQRKNLDHTGAPEVQFALSEGEEAVAVFAYCNLHSLWKADI